MSSTKIQLSPDIYTILLCHEAQISNDLFLQVNGLLNQNAHGYKIKEENNALPLKRFVHCNECSKPMRGYIVKKKNIYYYKCNTIGCGNNKNALSLNQMFARDTRRFIK